MRYFIFVYGTLRKEAATAMSSVLARHCEYFSDGYIQGKLYEVNGYPGLVESEDTDDKVKGELYRIVSRGLVLPWLDEYEECTANYPRPHQYIRKKLLAGLPEGGAVPAWVYVFNRDISNLRQIKSGDYLQFLAGINSKET